MNWIIIKKFPLDQDLSLINEFLHQQKIVHNFYEDNGEQVLAVVDARVVDSITQFLVDIEQGRIVIERVAGSSTAIQSSNTYNVASLLKEFVAAPITIFLVILSVIGALIVGFSRDFILPHLLSFQGTAEYGFFPITYFLAKGEWWRLITPAFLHFGVMHVLFNSLWMLDLGRRVEIFVGKLQYLIFFLVTGVISNVIQYLWSPNQLFGGMSGVVYAVVGYIFVAKKMNPKLFLDVRQAVLITVFISLILCIVGVMDIVFGISVANAAHVGGLISGSLFAFFTVRHRPTD